jgi:hypothetical protein
MAVIDTILSALTGKLSETIKGILSSVITTDKERLEAQQKIDETLANYANSLTEAASEVVQTEAKGGMLQRNWRPILMLMFGFILIYEYFIAQLFNLPKSNLPSEFWSLLELGIGGYVVGRTAEKITDSITSK